MLNLEGKGKINMIYWYKEAFTGRDDIGICPNIEVEIDVIDNTPLFIRPLVKV